MEGGNEKAEEIFLKVVYQLGQWAGTYSVSLSAQAALGASRKITLPSLVFTQSLQRKDLRDLVFFTDLDSVSFCNPESRCFWTGLGSKM